MKLPKWLHRFRRPRAVPPKAKLFCEECKRPVHKHDKYRIIKVQHLNCGDPKFVGQTSLIAKVDAGELVSDLKQDGQMSLPAKGE